MRSCPCRFPGFLCTLHDDSGSDEFTSRITVQAARFLRDPWSPRNGARAFPHDPCRRSPAYPPLRLQQPPRLDRFPAGRRQRRYRVFRLSGPGRAPRRSATCAGHGDRARTVWSTLDLVAGDPAGKLSACRTRALHQMPKPWRNIRIGQRAGLRPEGTRKRRHWKTWKKLSLPGSARSCSSRRSSTSRAPQAEPDHGAGYAELSTTSRSWTIPTGTTPTASSPWIQGAPGARARKAAGGAGEQEERAASVRAREGAEHLAVRSQKQVDVFVANSNSTPEEEAQAFTCTTKRVTPLGQEKSRVPTTVVKTSTPAPRSARRCTRRRAWTATPKRRGTASTPWTLASRSRTRSAACRCSLAATRCLIWRASSDAASFPIDARLDLQWHAGRGRAQRRRKIPPGDARSPGALRAHRARKRTALPGRRGGPPGRAVGLALEGRASSSVDAFASAHAEDGGEGATYVLLRK